jgi:hypothetical protein
MLAFFDLQNPLLLTLNYKIGHFFSYLREIFPKVSPGNQFLLQVLITSLMMVRKYRNT